jgi:hypothetical protein
VDPERLRMLFRKSPTTPTPNLRISPRLQEQLSKLSEEDSKRYMVGVNIMTFSIVCWALNEAIAILAFVSIFLGLPIKFVPLFSAVALGLNFWMRPKIADLVGILR